MPYQVSAVKPLLDDRAWLQCRVLEVQSHTPRTFAIKYSHHGYEFTAHGSFLIKLISTRVKAVTQEGQIMLGNEDFDDVNVIQGKQMAVMQGAHGACSYQRPDGTACGSSTLECLPL